MKVQVGEIYGKETTAKFVMCNVLKVSKTKGSNDEVVTLQNIDNPLAIFEISLQKLTSAGYMRLSQTPFIDLATTPKHRKASKKNLLKPQRCPLTFDFLEERADSQRPAPIHQDLFA